MSRLAVSRSPNDAGSGAPYPLTLMHPLAIFPRPWTSLVRGEVPSRTCMNRRCVMAILKMATCALVLPGFSGCLCFHKDTTSELKPPDNAITRHAALSGENLIPPNPRRDLDLPPEHELPTDPPEEALIQTSLKTAKPDTPAPPDDPLVKVLESVLKNRHNDALRYLDAFNSATQEKRRRK